VQKVPEALQSIFIVYKDTSMVNLGFELRGKRGKNVPR